MKDMNQTRCRRQPAFTLIELLVVIAIIGVLAALIFPTLGAVKKAATRVKVRTELKQIETAIDSYKAKYGSYPPDNPGFPSANQLFYELVGTVDKGQAFETLDGREVIQKTSLTVAFGTNVAGFVNCTRAGDAGDSKAAEKFLNRLRSDQYGFATNASDPNVHFVMLGTVVPATRELNPWRYNSSNPTNNPKSYDLWVDIAVGGKINRVSNWNKQYEVVN